MSTNNSTQIKISVTSYTSERSITRYVIAVECTNQKKWQILKRYSEVEEIHNRLQELFNNLPQFPKKQLFHLNRSEIEFRMQQLDDYLNQLLSRREILNSAILRDFLILDQYDEFLHPAQVQHRILNMSLKDIHENDNITLLLLYDSSRMARIDTYINNILESKKQSPISTLICFSQNDFKQKIFSKEYLKALTCMSFNNTENAFAVGLSSGLVYYYRLDEKYAIDMEEQFQLAQSKISGCVLIQREIYAITNNLLKIQNTKKIQEQQEIPIGSQELTNIIYNSTRNLVVIANNVGEIYLCQVPFVKIGLKVSTQSTQIIQLLIDNERNYLMALNHEPSHIIIFDFAKGLQNGYAQIKTNIEIKNKSLCFEWSKKRGEIFIGNEDGTISIWHVQDLQPFYVFKAHSKKVNKIVWNENKSFLLTGSDDESLKQWYLPKKWRIGQADNFSTF
ncbi:unnamed protein product (macronuclear) [Paramecium tetraurelia]|uniref:PX domain-containing protein n=1 Tax=Paramecium tetraurelia TaxID=5888 RepID=A0DAA5_PARTE|nr:uncharacterized protein GSPATT00014879001 [Paramecium tetraurelia]CAK79972.1 unnamed protein product [Paramecium tetraurelia]|eukprot:XP_001447369.1 hypothetical protein (macronuclear) [Paramecium tetraurelia strain d4-2]